MIVPVPQPVSIIIIIISPLCSLLPNPGLDVLVYPVENGNYICI
jgi:hypothetical protein